MYRTVLYYKTMFMKRTNKSLNHAIRTFKDINMLKLPRSCLQQIQMARCKSEFTFIEGHGNKGLPRHTVIRSYFHDRALLPPTGQERKKMTYMFVLITYFSAV